MEINLFGYQFTFGRPKKAPQRDTLQQTLNLLPTGVERKQTVKKPNAPTLRQFARSSIPRRAINIVKDGVLKLPYRVVPVDPNDTFDYSDVNKMVMDIITNPNDVDSYKDLWGCVLEDTMVGDCGCAEIVKVANPKKPIYLFMVDGFSIEHIQGYDSSNPLMPRYAQRQARNVIKPFQNEDLLFIKKNTFSFDPNGLSPLESAFQYVDYLLNTQMYANSVTSKGMPKFILNLGETLNETQIMAFRHYFTEEIMGSGDLPIVGGSKGISSAQIGAINDDGLFLSYQALLMTIIAFTFGVDPKKLGQGSATDRSTVDEQNESVLNEAVKPYADLLADAINSKIISRLGLKGKVRFEFVYEETLNQKQAKATTLGVMWMNDAISQNEQRQMYNLPPRVSKYADMTYSEFKAAINVDYPPPGGGFNGVGKDQHSKPKGGDTQNE